MQFGHPSPVKKLQREFEKVALTDSAGWCAQASREWLCWAGVGVPVPVGKVAGP